MRGRGAAAVTALAVLALAGPAEAAYNPQLNLILDDYGPGRAPALTSVMTQAPGEEATRTIAARFPLDFTLNPAFAVTGCAPADQQAATCPESSRLGAAKVKSPLGDGEGGVFLTTDFRLFVPLRAYADLYRYNAFGAIRGYDDGAELIFDNLPNLPVTEMRLFLDGGPRAILITPRRCGDYAAKTKLVSQSGVSVERALPVKITGCAEALALSALRVSPARVTAGRRPTLTWQLSEAASFTRIGLFRARRGGWAELASTRGPAAAGQNEMKLPRRWRRRLAAPGRYRLQLRARAPGGVISKSSATAFRVVRPRR